MRSLTRALSARTGRFDLMELAGGQLARFLAIGVVGLSVDILCFTLLHDAGLSRAVARAGSLSVATAVTWSLNRSFTFPSTGRRKRIEIIRYAAVVLMSQGFSYATFLVLSAALPNLPPVIPLVIGAVAATAFSFGGQRLFTFAGHPSQRTVP